jgi:hypothetical protein
MSSCSASCLWFAEVTGVAADCQYHAAFVVCDHGFFLGCCNYAHTRVNFSNCKCADQSLLPKSMNWPMDVVSSQMNSLTCVRVWFGCVYPPCLDLLKLVCRLMPSSSRLKLRRLSLWWEVNHDRNIGCWLLSTMIIVEYGLRLIAIFFMCA